MLDDFYMNLVDWSNRNMIVVGLDDEVWLHHLSKGKTIRLCTLRNDDGVSSVTWNPGSMNVAVGTFNSGVRYYDIRDGKLIRKFKREGGRVSAVAFNSEHTFASGCYDGSI